MNSLFIDYAVFGLLILATLAFNIYSNVSGPKERTKADYVFASGRSASTFVMLLSISRGFLGVRVFLGYPSELFYRGSEMWETLYGILLAFPVVAYFFVPVYFNLGITSVYQYLDLRFKSRLVRCLASSTFVIRNSLQLGVTIFTPCVALKTVIGMPYWLSIVGISSIGIIFTILGGLRSAIMTDMLQGLAMIGCTVIIIIQGTITAEEGPIEIIKKSYERGRLNFLNFDLDPTKRVTTVSALLGQFFISLSLYGCQQTFVQRYLSMKTKENVIRTLWLNVPFMTLLMSSSWIVGVVIFAHYADCDPKILGYISDIDEILPFYLEDKFEFLPGFLGLTMACLFNGGLSFLASNLNSMATVIWEDFLSPLSMMKNLSDKKQIYVIKFTGVILGICIMFISFVVSNFSGLIESSMLMTSATSGPLLGVFILAMFIPIANWKGAALGMILSNLVTIWIIFGSLSLEKPPVKYLPTTINDCSNDTFSQYITQQFSPRMQNKITPILETSIFDTNSTDFLNDYKDQVFSDNLEMEIIPTDENGTGIFMYLYKMTYMYYALLGSTITVVVGTLVSYFTGMPEKCRYSETLLHPASRKVCSWFPGTRSYFEEISFVKEEITTSNFSAKKISVNTTNEKSYSYKNKSFVDENVDC